MVAVIDQRVIKCRFIGEFSYSVSFLTIISRSRIVRACLKTDPVGRLKLPWVTLNSSMMLFLHHVFLSEHTLLISVDLAITFVILDTLNIFLIDFFLID